MKTARLARRYALDAAVAGIAAGAVVEAAITTVDGPRAALVGFALLWSSPLLLRRRFPLSAPLAVFAAAAVEAFVAPEAVPGMTTPFLAVLLAVWVGGADNELPQALAGLAASLLALGIVVVREPGGSVVEFLGVAGFFLLTWLAGAAFNRRTAQTAALRQQAAELERRRAEATRIAAGEERARIARELNDVVAHAVVQMTVQAGAVRRLLTPGQEREREALESVERTGREALAEMRRVLGVLRPSDCTPELEPQPRLDRLEALMSRARGAGLDVELTVEGERKPLAPGVEVCAYRIVQEALDNALRHAAGEAASVSLRYGDGTLEVRVENDGTSVGNGSAPGHGLLGMQERVLACGGRLEAGPRAGGGYRVRATLPVEPAPVESAP